MLFSFTVANLTLRVKGIQWCNVVDIYIIYFDTFVNKTIKLKSLCVSMQ